MKFKRKPVERDVVDALLNEEKGVYVVLRADGKFAEIPRDLFEADYEQVRRQRTAKPKKPRKPRRNSDQPGAAP